MVLHHFCKGLKHPRFGNMQGLLEPVPLWYWGITIHFLQLSYKVPQMRYLNRNLFPHRYGGQKSEIMCWQIWFLLRPLLGLQRATWCFLLRSFLCVCTSPISLYFCKFPLIRTLHWFRAHPMTSICFNCLLKGLSPNSVLFCVWGMGTQFTPEQCGMLYWLNVIFWFIFWGIDLSFSCDIFGFLVTVMLVLCYEFWTVSYSFFGKSLRRVCVMFPFSFVVVVSSVFLSVCLKFCQFYSLSKNQLLISLLFSVVSSLLLLSLCYQLLEPLPFLFPKV